APLRSASPLRRRLRTIARSRSIWLGASIVLVLVVMALSANVISPYDADARHEQLAPPSSAHWLGTDADQKDVLTRVIYGSRLSLLAGGLSIVLAIGLGVPIGAVAGYCGGSIDAWLMRTIDVALAFPSILIALLIASALQPGWTAVILAVGLINVPVFARQIRATVMVMRDLDYVVASRAMGASGWHIVTYVLLPGIVSPVLVLATLGLGSAILEVAGLSFLGIGGDPTEPEWGTMLRQAKEHLSASIWPAIGPGLSISLSILGFNLLGDGLRDLLDPQLTGRL
ncbi:MAG TPA: ABC transporter permease, partial [Pirellulaceae bacterium]|nr:ABC transporter permease [Pirellulaceae bacterium]